MGKSMKAYASAAKGIKKLMVAVKSGTGIFGKLGTALGGISAPVLAIVAVIAVLVAAFTHLWKTNDGFRENIIATWTQIKETVSNFCQGIVDRLNSLGFEFSSITEVLKAVWDGFCNLLGPVFEGAFRFISDTLSTVLDVILNTVDFFIAVFSGDWEGAWEAVKNIFSSIWNGLVSWFTNILETIKGVLDVALGWIGSSWEQVWSGVKNFFTNIWKTGNLTFRIAPTHPLYGQIQKLKSEIAVYQDNERLGAFRVLNVEQDFNNIKTVTCEGELAYLLDSVQRAAEYHDVTVAEYFAIVVANHNADVDSSKQFTVGAVTVTDPNDSLYRIHSYENTWECIEDKLLDRLGGYIRIRMSGSTRLIDYVTSYGNVNPQIIRFGENILDLVREVRGENVATVLVPLGAADEETGEKLTVKSVNDGLDYIEDAEAIETYGRIVKTVEYDDVTVASNLLTKGYAELAKMSKPTITLTMTAVDLHLVDVNIERIKIGDSIRVLSEPHGIDEYMIVQKLQLDFQHPENSVVTLGAVKQTLDGNVGKRKSEPLDAIIAQQAAMQQTISSVQTTVQECYSEISKTAEEIRTEVSESYLAKTELETIQRDFQTSITQSASEIRMDFTTITKRNICHVPQWHGNHSN